MTYEAAKPPLLWGHVGPLQIELATKREELATEREEYARILDKLLQPLRDELTAARQDALDTRRALGVYRAAAETWCPISVCSAIHARVASIRTRIEGIGTYEHTT